MHDANLKLVDDLTDQDIAAIESDMRSAKKLSDGSGGGHTITVLPPEGGDGGDDVRYDDLANSERLLATFGDDLLYVVEAKKWLCWNGVFWEFDATNEVFDRATKFSKMLYAPEYCRDDVAFKHAKRSNMRTGINAMVELAAKRQAISMTEFDKDPYLLNCYNGTLDLRTGELKKHNRADRITRVVNSEFNADAESPNFDQFLETIQPDPSIRAFLQRSIGYSLLGVVRERAFWILYGTGNNGKSVFVNLFNNLLGEYGAATTTSSVMAGKQSAIPNDIARLKGKRYVIIPETEENERMNSALVKALSAGDKVTARFLFGEYFDFYFSGKLWIATNHKPLITDHSKGFWDRLKLIPFSQDIPKEKIIKADDLMDTFRAEFAGILNWAVLGCRDYFDLNELAVPDVILKEIEQYKYEQDSLAQFADEMLVLDKYATTDNGKLFGAFKAWCNQNSMFQISQQIFTIRMKQRGYVQRNSGGRFWDGIRLVDP